MKHLLFNSVVLSALTYLLMVGGVLEKPEFLTNSEPPAPVKQQAQISRDEAVQVTSPEPGAAVPLAASEPQPEPLEEPTPAPAPIMESEVISDTPSITETASASIDDGVFVSPADLEGDAEQAPPLMTAESTPSAPIHEPVQIDPASAQPAPVQPVTVNQVAEQTVDAEPTLSQSPQSNITTQPTPTAVVQPASEPDYMSDRQRVRELSRMISELETLYLDRVFAE